MTSVTGEPRGFSLLELLIVVSVIVLFSGLFALRFDDSQSEELLARATVDLKAAALKAKRRSYAFRRDHYVVFSRRTFRLSEMALSEAGGSSGEDKSGDFERIALPPGVLMELRPGGAGKWITPDHFVWMFRDSGMSDPLAVRFSVEDSDSYSTLTFNVLTGLAEEETFIE
ncbi:MAG: prepilin-type N-terminal cleavage/methylation domain-containing protein [Verrucomicrobiales bacterium]